jgi:hypothetical protein
MSPEETRAYVLKIVDNVHAWKAEEDAREPERQRLKLESHLALERLHRAVEALKAARP